MTMNLWTMLSTIGQGAFITLSLSFISYGIGLILGTVLSVIRSVSSISRPLIRFLISILRGTPIILQLSVMHFVFPQITGIKMDIFVTGLITFGINSAAYVSEILRAGIESIPKGQYEAAQALMIPRFYLWKDIILPQVFRAVLPTLLNEKIALLKETAIISIIGGMDIMRRADMIAAQTYDYYTPLLIAAFYYYIIVVCLETIVFTIQKKVNHVKT